MTAYVTLLELYVGPNGRDLWSLVTSKPCLRACGALYLSLLLAEECQTVVVAALGFALGALYISMTRDPQPNPMYERHMSLKSTTDAPPMAGHGTLQLFDAHLTLAVQKLLAFVCRDFILNWWSPLNVNGDPGFEKAAQQSLNAAITNMEQIFLRQEKNDIVMTTVYGMANTLIIHLRECQSFEASGLPLDLYISRNPHSPFAQTLPIKEQYSHLCSLSNLILKRILPPAESHSPVVLSLMKAIFTTHMFGNVLDSCSDPDFINGWVIEMLNDAPDTEDGIEHSNGSSTEYDGLRSVVEKATDDIIAESGQTDLAPSPPEMTSDEESSPVSPLNGTNPPMSPRPQAHTPSMQNTELCATTKELHHEEHFLQPSVIYPCGTIGFDVMDISDLSKAQPGTSQNSRHHVYSIQIERPAMQDKPGSEGGGYVISRSYLDFVTFHAMMRARHSEVVQQLDICLPFGSNNNEVCPALEQYLYRVVGNDLLGRDTLIARFLRKEPRVDQSGNLDVSFSGEYADKVDLEDTSTSRTSNDIGSVNRAMAFLTRTSSFQTKGSAPIDATKRWFNRKVGRDNPASSGENTKSQTIVDGQEDDRLTPETRAVKTELTCMDNRTARGTRSPKRRSTMKHKSLAPSDIELLIETTFALVVEIFDLTVSNNKAWVRRSLLNVLREIVRRSYTEIISKQYDDYINTYLAPEAFVRLTEQTSERFWPNGEWRGEPSSRTDQEKNDTKLQAREMLMNKAIPSSVRQLIGDQNCNAAMERLWSRFQNAELNRILLLQLLDRMIRPIFS